MKPLAAMLVLLVTATSLTWSRAEEPADEDIAAGRFMALPVYVDSDDAPLAAYQFHLSDRAGRMRVVGVESGEHAAFAEAPYFDREAVEQGRADRIIVAAFSIEPAEALPTGRTRVATVHVHVEAEAAPQWQLTLVRAGDAAGEPIEATITMDEPVDEP